MSQGLPLFINYCVFVKNLLEDGQMKNDYFPLNWSHVMRRAGFSILCIWSINEAK